MRAGDGARLHGWLRRGTGGAGRRGLVIYFGGNAEEVSGQVLDADAVAPWSLAAFNYRGYGLSEGRPSETALVADALVVYDRLAAREDIDPDRIVVFGRSLGSGVAVPLAAARPVRGVVLVSPFDSLRSVGRRHYPFVPVSLLLRHPFDSLAHAPSLEAPLLVIAGERDRIIPAPHSKRLLEAWTGAKRWVLLPGADHNGIHLHPGYRPRAPRVSRVSGSREVGLVAASRRRMRHDGRRARWDLIAREAHAPNRGMIRRSPRAVHREGVRFASIRTAVITSPSGVVATAANGFPVNSSARASCVIRKQENRYDGQIQPERRHPWIQSDQSMSEPVVPVADEVPQDPSPTVAPAGRRLEYDGARGPVAKIAVSNALLTLVTLGVYRFWGKTRVRRYLWSRASFLGDRAEYTGTGGSSSSASSRRSSCSRSSPRCPSGSSGRSDWTIRPTGPRRPSTRSSLSSFSSWPSTARGATA